MTRRPNLVHPLAMLLGTMVEALEEEIHPSRTTPRLGGVDPMTTERTMATTMSQPSKPNRTITIAIENSRMRRPTSRSPLFAWREQLTPEQGSADDGVTGEGGVDPSVSAGWPVPRGHRDAGRPLARASEGPWRSPVKAGERRRRLCLPRTDFLGG